MYMLQMLKLTIFEKIWIPIFFIIVAITTISTEGLSIGLLASITGVICAVLVAKGSKLNYIFGIVNVLAYSYVSLQARYFGEVMLFMLFHFPMQFVGWAMWSKNEEIVQGVVRARRLSYRALFGIFTWSIVAIGLYSYALKIIGNTLPYANGITVVLSIVAMGLLVFRYVEQWVFWILVDLVAIYMWYYTNSSPAVLLMWCAYLVNAVYGLFSWIKLDTKQNTILVDDTVDRTVSRIRID